MPESTSIRELKRLGQSVWLDQLDRRMIRSGELERYRDAGVSGVTANPTIFAKALEGSEVYAPDVRRLLEGGMNAADAVWTLLIEDVQAAADVFRPVFENTGGADGFVSIEVSPELAFDTDATIAAARDLHRRCDRPNVMVKIPATLAGLPAIETMIAGGVNVNVTLIFSVERYAQVVDAFFAGLERLRGRGVDVRNVRSVASFFVSRVDNKVDAQLERLIAAAPPERKPALTALLGKAAIANSKIAYEMFGRLHSGPRWEALRDAGATVQRCLWASTSTKNPRYRDTMYVDQLIGPATINTMPPATFDAFIEHGKAEPSLQQDVDGARMLLDRLAAAGVDLAAVTQQLEDEGVAAFAKSFRESVERLGKVTAAKG